MYTNGREEIAASVAAQQTLGPGYDQALAEGLVERIGEEIDNRITAQIDQRLADEDRGGALPDPHLECRHTRRARRRAERAGRPSVLLALGSMAAAILASMVVLLSDTGTVAGPNGSITKAGPGSAALMLTALIWVIIAVVNVAYVRAGSLRRGPGDTR